MYFYVFFVFFKRKKKKKRKKVVLIFHLVLLGIELGPLEWAGLGWKITNHTVGQLSYGDYEYEYEYEKCRCCLLIKTRLHNLQHGHTTCNMVLRFKHSVSLNINFIF